jgi:hypothetical protein
MVNAPGEASQWKAQRPHPVQASGFSWGLRDTRLRARTDGGQCMTQVSHRIPCSFKHEAGFSLTLAIGGTVPSLRNESAPEGQARMQSMSGHHRHGLVSGWSMGVPSALPAIGPRCSMTPWGQALEQAWHRSQIVRKEASSDTAPGGRWWLWISLEAGEVASRNSCR